MFLSFSQTKFWSDVTPVVTTEVRSFSKVFENSSIVGNSITVVHNLLSEDIIVTLMSPESEQYAPSSIVVINKYSASVGLEGLPVIQGEWVITIYARSSAYSSGASGYAISFTSSDLSEDSQLVVTHNLSSTNVLCIIYDNTKKLFEPYSIGIIDSNTVLVDFRYMIESMSGTWRAIFITSAISKGNVSAYSQTFSLSDIVAGVLSVTHTLLSTDIAVNITDSTGETWVPSDIVIVSDSSVEIYFDGFNDLTGIWTVTILAVT